MMTHGYQVPLIRTVRKLPAAWILMAFMMGFGGQLFLTVPALGVIPMFDLVSYAIGIPCLVMNWSRMGKVAHRCVFWGVAWTLAALVANLCYADGSRMIYKCTTIAASSWLLFAVAFSVLKKDARLYLWYLVGTGLGGWLSLYHFQQGAYLAAMVKQGTFIAEEALMEKQRFPFVAKGIFYGLIFPVFLMLPRAPVFGVILATLGIGFFLLLHGGSRSNFGIFCASAAMGFACMYNKAAIRRLAKRPIMMLIVIAFGIATLFGTYVMLAKGGAMGEGESDKYEAEFGQTEAGSGGLSSRTGYAYAFETAFSNPTGIGGQLRCHSTIFNSLACEGWIGFFYWIYFFWIVFWFVTHRVVYMRQWVPFVMVTIVSASWDALGSPFGARHFYFVLMAYIALCRDNPLYGVGSVIDSNMLMQRRLI